MTEFTITDVKIRKVYEESRLKALVSITLNDCFAVHDIKVIAGPERFFIAMPSRREPNGTFRDIVHPINEPMRHYIEKTILEHYYAYLEEHPVTEATAHIAPEHGPIA